MFRLIFFVVVLGNSVSLNSIFAICLYVGSVLLNSNTFCSKKCFFSASASAEYISATMAPSFSDTMISLISLMLSKSFCSSSSGETFLPLPRIIRFFFLPEMKRKSSFNSPMSPVLNQIPSKTSFVAHALKLF